MPEANDEQFREQAERLKQLPRAEQRAIVELIGSPADNPKVSKANRMEARRRADALARLLKLNPRKKRQH